MSEQYIQSAEEIAALAAALAEEDDDMNEVQVGGGGFGRRLPVGWSVARLTSYIEKGKHIELYQGKPKDPALMFTLGFELFSPQYLNEDGTPYFIETRNKARSRNEKAGAFKLFKAMNYKGLAKNFAQLLGNGNVFLVEIKDYLPKNAKPGQEPRSVIGEVRAGINVVDNTEYACPPATKLFLFSWAKPTLSAWDAMFIEGTRDDGKSKNWKQEEIAGATDFAGSPLEGLLLTNGRPIPAGRPQPTGVTAPAGAQPAGAAPAGVAAPVAAAAPAAAPVAAASPAVAPNVAASPVAAAPVAAPSVSPSVTPSAPASTVTTVSPSSAPVVAAAPVVPAAPVVAAPLAQ